MELKIITGREAVTDKMYSAPDCRQLIDIYRDYYKRNGFQSPWLGYFVIRQNEVVGSCGFVGQPQNGKVEIAYQAFKNSDGKGIGTFAREVLTSIARLADPDLKVTSRTWPSGFVFL